MVAVAADKPPGRTVRFYGGNRELFLERGGECLLSGPAGTGKSIACLTKVFLFAERYPHSRCLIVRKTQKSLTESGLVTWENEVVPAGHPCLWGPQRRLRQSYRFPNGSEVIVGGLNNSQKIMSTAYDLIYVQEAIECAEKEWEDLTTRLRKRNDDGAPTGVTYRQIIADTNPDRPTHWLKRRCDRGATRLIESRHEDNPSLYDPKTGQITKDGAVYIAKLDALTGPRKPRLRYGRWVQAEGVVYENWDASVHLIDRFPIPAGWPRFLSVDFGYTNPFVCGWYAMDPDGRLYRYREIYHTGRLVADHAKTILKASGAWTPDGPNWARASEPAPSMVFCDHDAGDRATLARHLGLYCAPAVKAVSVGIQSVTDRLAVQPDGKPRLFLLRDSLVERDPKLADANLPCCAADEFDSYVWAKTADGRPVKEEPVKLHDHAMDEIRYMVHTLAVRGYCPLTPDTVSTGGVGEFGAVFDRRVSGSDGDDGESVESLFMRMDN